MLEVNDVMGMHVKMRKVLEVIVVMGMKVEWVRMLAKVGCLRETVIIQQTSRIAGESYQSTHLTSDALFSDLVLGNLHLTTVASRLDSSSFVSRTNASTVHETTF